MCYGLVSVYACHVYFEEVKDFILVSHGFFAVCALQTYLGVVNGVLLSKDTILYSA